MESEEQGAGTLRSLGRSLTAHPPGPWEPFYWELSIRAGLGEGAHVLGTGTEDPGPYPGVRQVGAELRDGAGLGSVSRPGQEHGGPSAAAAPEAAAAVARGLLGLAASPEEEGAGREAGEGAGRGRAKGLAALEATWLVGQGLQGMDQAGPATCLRPGGGSGVRG